MKLQSVKFIVVAVLSIVSCKASIKQVEYSPSSIFPISINGNWYAKDTLGKILNDRIYDELHLFKYGLSAAKEINNNKYGYINIYGDWAIKPKFDEVDDFYRNCAKVKLNGDEFYINRKGRKMKFSECSESRLIPSCYEGNDMSKVFDVESYVIKKENKYAIRYEQTKDTSLYIYDSVKAFDGDFFIVERNKKYRFILRHLPMEKNDFNYKGDLIEDYIYEEIVVSEPKVNKYSGLHHRLAEFHKYRIGEKWGLLYWNKKRITEAKYYSIELNNEEEYFLVEYEKDKFGYINKHGKEMFR